MKKNLRQVGYLQRLYRDAARSTEHKIINTSLFCFIFYRRINTMFYVESPFLQQL